MLLFLLWVLIFIVSSIALFKSSDYFTDSAEALGLFFKLPGFIVGVTIVAIGTSLPELVSSIFAVLGGSSEIVCGQVVGSNITNIFLILGVSAIVGRKMRFNYNIINVDLPLLMGSAFLFLIMALDGEFTFPEAVLSLLGVLTYLFHSALVEKRIKKEEAKIERELKRELRIFGFSFRDFPWRSLTTLFLSASVIFLSAKYTIESALFLADFLEIGREVIAASVIALGTSLPELAVSVAAVRRGKAEVAVGSILGSNIFNSLGVTGVAGLLGTLVVSPSIVIFGLPMMIVATLLYLFMTQDREITRYEGGFLIIFYFFYLGKLFGMI